MRTRLRVMAAALTLLPVGAAAQRPRDTGPARTTRPAAARIFDPTTVETLVGTAVRIDTVGARRGLEGGVHVQLRTGAETIPVHLGPTWYLARRATRLATGARLTVRGSRVSFAGKPAIIAATLQTGTTQLTLRDSVGVPAWSRRTPRYRPPEERP